MGDEWVSADETESERRQGGFDVAFSFERWRDG
jgi:hypothetical protein